MALAAAMLGTATPVLASSTILCTSTTSPGDGPELYLNVGSGEAGGIFQASFSLGNEHFTTGQGSGAPVIAQSWIDREQLKVQLADANGEAILVRLDTRRGAGNDYLGMLIHRGRTWRVRCGEEG